MNHVLSGILYSRQRERYNEIARYALQFSRDYCGEMIIRDGILNAMQNYARRNDVRMELLCYAFEDEDLWAITFAKKGIVFVCINTELPLCKQFFAAAHELYHFYCYVEKSDDSYIRNGSLLNAEIADEVGETQEDLEANAYAGLVLMPDAALEEQMRLNGITRESIDIDAVLTLADVFAMPYKAAVLRLYESGQIDVRRAEELLTMPQEEITARIRLTGRTRRWQLTGVGTEQFGSLLERFDYCKGHGCLTDTRSAEDQEYIEQLRQQYGLE